ncbi:HNH endonuclease signature motif containing protein [Arthrobacter sp. AQ5-05]|uniref:HNH endonuclease signature motif containing protein n=1 Tax=Arthrobacter sp. AQ5-05 TaxID=2184581 RepID=UPI0012B5A67D|nr:HNH endonuclease signature motif containing protein [Arthrobacter sp. AQ5-05]
MDKFHPELIPQSAGTQPAAGSWSPAPGIVAAYPVQHPAYPARRQCARDLSCPGAPVPDLPVPNPPVPNPLELSRLLANVPHLPVASSDLDIDSIEALAEAEYLCSVSTLRSLALIESGIAAFKARAIERLDAASTRLGMVAELDPWQQEVLSISTTAELCAALVLPQCSGAELKRQSTSLVRQHPNTLAALSNGSISWRNTNAILDQLQTLAETKTPSGSQAVPDEALREFEHQLLDLAPGMTTAKFLVHARRLRERTHPYSMATRHVLAVDDRKLVLVPDQDGMSWLSMFLPADAAQGIWNQATRTARTLQGPREHRTLTQLRLDVLAQWLLATGTSPDQSHGAIKAGQAQDTVPVTDDAAPAQGSATRPLAQVLVTIPLLTVLGRSNEPAELEGYGPIPPKMAQELAAGCPTLYRIMVGPYTNEYLSMDPTRYRVSAATRIMLRARDGTCVGTGCNTVTADTELDHIPAWENGGASTPENLWSACGTHHRLEHFKDGKSRDGMRRLPRNAARNGPISGLNTGIMNGWTPTTAHAPAERPGWISPAGHLYPPEPTVNTPPLIPDLIMINAIEEMRGYQQP